MDATFVIVGALIVIGILSGIFKSDDNEEARVNAEMDRIANRNPTPYNPHEVNTEKETEIMENPKHNTQQLMVSTLTQIGCQPTVNEDDTVAVTYQGEHFHIDFGGLYAQIWDLGWAGVNINDPELPKIREAVNHTTFDFGPTVVMTSPDDKGTMYFHSRLGILLHPDIPEIDSYLRSNLDMFFRAKESVRQNFQQITIEQQKAREKRRPVGFTSNT